MVFLKTKNMHPKRIFLIVLALLAINGAVAALFADQLSAITEADSVVKDDSITLDDISPAENAPGVEALPAADDKPVITTYVVQKGDTLGSIAQQFSISTNTILWANDLTKKSVIREGQKLTILPVSGIQYTVGKGDTLGGIANKFDADVEEILSFNDLEEDKTIRVGMKLVIPNAELPSAPVEKAAPKKVAAKTTPGEVKRETQPVTPKVSAAVVTPTVSMATDTDTDGDDKPVTETGSTPKGYFTFPIANATYTQGIHGYNGIDLGAPVGTEVFAAASGKVIVSKQGGYNGGYGTYIVIEHDNGTQTLYGHLSKALVSVDDEVTKGQNIGLSGNTGKSTGPHLHFEVRGGANPWGGLKKGTKF